MSISWQVRVMTSADLNAVFSLQTEVYPLEMLEDPGFYANRLALAPESCWVAEDRERGVCGYLISYPWDAGLPPALNTPLSGLPQPAQTWFLHDCAVAPSMGRRGVARELFTHGLQWARCQRLRQASLVSLAHACDYWQRHGFEAVVADDDVHRKLAVYGEGARWMTRSLSCHTDRGF